MTYDVVRRLARGGMGVVDLARADDGRLVVLKRLALGGTADEMREARARFERELQVLRQLDHDAVVPLLDVIDDAGEIVLVMPYLSGGTLGERVRTDGPLPATEVRAMADRLLPALASAHRLGIIHRDCKPANVLFDDAGRAHLADFGVALTRDITGGLTRTGTVLGTPGFLSPEQARGEPLTPATDIASLGATLHFAATGHSPYGSGDAPAVLLRTARARSRVDRSIEPGLRRTITAMLDPRPERRPSAAALAGGVVDTNPIPMLVRRHRVLTAVVAAVLVAGLVAFGLSRWGEDDPSAVAPGDTASSSPSSTPGTVCQPLPYRPCGGTNAPNTDGRRCVGRRADYDSVASNGCEATPDDVDGSELAGRVVANIVPADDVDRYTVFIDDTGDLGCNNTFRLGIEAPKGMSLVAELYDDGGNLLGQTTSADGVAGRIEVRDPRCFRDDAGDFVVEVRPAGSDRTARPYVLTASGSF